MRNKSFEKAKNREKQGMRKVSIETQKKRKSNQEKCKKSCSLELLLNKLGGTPNKWYEFVFGLKCLSLVLSLRFTLGMSTKLPNLFRTLPLAYVTP